MFSSFLASAVVFGAVSMATFWGHFPIILKIGSFLKVSAVFVVVLGILIFVHELGHFLLAKRFGVGVQKFSLGFGPKLFGKQYGETEYLISAIPLGGYVKMVGEDPKEPLSPEEQTRSFNNQSVGKRLGIVAAGPAFNILFSVLVFLGMFIIGYPSEDTTIGWVEMKSPAWEAGLRSGDKVLSVNGESIKLWESLIQKIEQSETQPLSLEVQRGEALRKVTVQPKITEGKNLFGEREEYPYVGIEHHTLAAVVGVASVHSPAGRSDFVTGDQIVSVNGQEVENLPELERTLFQHLGNSVAFEVKREEEKIQLTVSLTDAEVQALGEDPDHTLERLGLLSSELFVRQVVSDSPAEAAGLRADDRIVQIDGERIYSFADLQKMISEKPGIPVTLELSRGGEPLTLSVTPEQATEKDGMGNKISVGRIGILSSYYPIPGPTLAVHYNPFTALVKALSLTWKYTELILVSLVKLVQQVIPAETMGGPIFIAQLAGQQAEYGILELFKFMALISINLGILNLLPIPILDGGHILFFAIEGLLGRPLSMKKREMAQQVGLLLLLSLILFVTYNDIMRIFG